MLAKIVVGDKVNLAKLVKHHFRPSKNMTEQKLNIRALVFCLLNHYLLSNNNGEFGDIRLIPLISQMESCYSIMPLVVAETLLSADELKKDAKSEIFKGSPLLLQVIDRSFAYTFYSFPFSFVSTAPCLELIFSAQSWASYILAPGPGR